MERKWKEGTSDHAGGSLKWNDDDLLLCGDGPGCKLMKEDATSGGLFTEAITKVQDVFEAATLLRLWWLWDFCTALYLCRRKTVIW